MEIGKLYGISVGPGDPELITLKGFNRLKRSPVVAFPEGINGKLGIAEAIVQQWLNPDQTRLSLTFPYVQDNEVLSQAWHKAAQQVWEHLKSGQDVAFVCEGDVSFYSTFTYLAQTLQKLHPEAAIESIPGVCSPLAAIAQLGIPLTVRDQRLAILPALYRVGELEEVLAWADVVVLLKMSSVYQELWTILQRQELLERSWVVERATLANQIIYSDLRNHPNLTLSYFSLLIVQAAN